MAEKILKRSEVLEKFKWAIEDLYKTDVEWQSEFQEVKELGEKLKDYKGRLSESGSVLYEFLSLKDQVSKKLERVSVYAYQKSHEDTKNATYQQFANKAENLMVNVSSTVSFAVPEILSISNNVIEEYLKETDELKVYKRYLDEVMRQKEHILSSEMEELLASAGEMAESASNIFNMFHDADLKFPEIKNEKGESIEITHGRFMPLLESKDRKVREDVFKGVYATYRNFQNTLAAAFSSNIKKETFFAKARKYNSTLEMALDDGNIPVSVYNNLIEAVHENLPLMHRYVSLRKRMLQVGELHMYDLYTPLITDVDMKISFEEAKDIVYKGLEPLGDAYRSALKEGYENRWIDIYENEGKRSGAYSWGAYGTHPYVLLNYQENLKNVFTLAHEMGHALHSYHSDKTQPYIYAGYVIFVAEVASTCNEALLMHYLLKNSQDKNQKMYLLNHYLEEFRTTLFRQTMFAEFEKITHSQVEEGEVLTSEKLCEIYHALNENYYGKDIVIDAEIDMEWSRIPHFYTPFYVYQYATGYSAAIALSSRILKEGRAAVDDYINKFLCGGSSKDPIDLLRGAGVDMSSKEPVNEALKVFGELLDQFETMIPC